MIHDCRPGARLRYGQRLTWRLDVGSVGVLVACGSLFGLIACARSPSTPVPAPRAPAAASVAPPAARPAVTDTTVAVVIPDPEHGDAVYRVHASGAAERVWPPRDAPPVVWSVAGPAGSDRMTPSADRVHETELVVVTIATGAVKGRTAVPGASR